MAVIPDNRPLLAILMEENVITPEELSAETGVPLEVILMVRDGYGDKVLCGQLKTLARHFRVGISELAYGHEGPPRKCTLNAQEPVVVDAFLLDWEEALAVMKEGEWVTHREYPDARVCLFVRGDEGFEMGYDIRLSPGNQTTYTVPGDMGTEEFFRKNFNTERRKIRKIIDDSISGSRDKREWLITPKRVMSHQEIATEDRRKELLVTYKALEQLFIAPITTLSSDQSPE